MLNTYAEEAQDSLCIYSLYIVYIFYLFFLKILKATWKKKFKGKLFFFQRL